jgi:hypothetical protein
MSQKKQFHFCGCVSTWKLTPIGSWKLASFEQACDWRWRVGHFGASRAEELEAEAGDEEHEP